MGGNHKFRSPLTLDEVCKRLRVSRPKAVRLIRAGVLRAAKVGRTWRIPESAVEALLAPQPEAAE